MDFIELGDVGSGCEDENCGLASSPLEDCPNQECQWEEPDFGLVELVCVTVIYIPLMLFGLLGNVLTILVVWLRPHMRSSTYLYLSSMAVSDLLILLLLPLDLYKLWRPRPWPFGDLACKLTMFMSECCTFCTILHITFLSVERYLAVCWPITAKTLVTRRRTRVLIGCLWLGAAISAAPVLVMVGVEEVRGEESGLGGRECRCTNYAVSSGLLSSMMILSNLYFLVPFCILGLVYSLIGRTLWLRPQSSRRDQSHRHTVKMLGVIVLAFVFCWLPFHVGRTIFSLSQGTSTDGQEAYAYMNTHSEMINISESKDKDIHVHTDEDTHLADAKIQTHRNRETQYEDMSIDVDLYSHVKTSRGVHNVDHSIDTVSHTRTRNNTTPADRQIGRVTDTKTNLHNITNTSLTQRVTDTDTKVSHSQTSFLTDTSTHSYGPTFTEQLILTTEPNKIQVCRKSEENTAPTSDTSTQPVTQAYLYDEIPFNVTYKPPDTYYFLYYLSQYFNLVSSVLFYLSAAVNPLLYNLMSARYRHAVHSLIHTHSHTQTHHRRRTLTGQHSTTTTL
ncbi:uncharacterized protein LOC117832955 [Xyrichtys novacula]|uniref:Growth hormone secretagogue receptor type 1 n=1 Tax=Xyrichtys novacula TaxID=13765 RepID=A0AAV1GUA4_XYRNO|nr:uncharacterized protein LOC117832955 [Xyrichtys novacula]